jgi:hypothetical protein
MILYNQKTSQKLQDTLQTEDCSEKTPRTLKPSKTTHNNKQRKTKLKHEHQYSSFDKAECSP